MRDETLEREGGLVAERVHEYLHEIYKRATLSNQTSLRWESGWFASFEIYMNYPVYVLLVGGLVGAWMLVLILFEKSLVIFVATIIIMSLLISSLFYYNSNVFGDNE